MRSLRAWLLGCAICSSHPLAAVEVADGAFYEICVNGSCSLPALVLTDEAGRRWVDVVAFDQLHVPHTGWASRRLGESLHVDPLSRYPDATLRVDDGALRIELHLPAQAWPERSYSWGPRTTRPRVRPGPGVSGYLDYSLYGFSGASPAMYGETGVVRGASLLRTGFELGEHGASRGFTSLEVEDIEHRRRLVLGDQYLGGRDPFATGAMIGGVGVSSAHELDPYMVRFPGAELRGLMSAPGSVDVYANGQLVARQQVAAGPFSIDDVLLAQGNNDIRIVVNDPFAGAYEISSTYYGSASTLAAGLHEYAYRLGRVRRTGRDRYEEQWMRSGFHRYGLSGWLTAGARYESSGQRSHGGLTADLRLPLGALGLAWAKSRDADGAGIARRADYGYQSRRFALGLGWEAQSRAYMPLLEPGSAEDASRRTGLRYAAASLALPRQASLAVRHQKTLFRGRQDLASSSARLSSRLGADAQLQLEAGRRQWVVGRGERYFQLNYLVRLERASAAIRTTQSSSGARDVVAAYYRPRPGFDRGTGYRGEVGRQDGRSHVYGEVEHARPQGHVQLAMRRRGEDTTYSARFSGSLLWAGGGLYPVQTGSTGYALVRTQGATGVPVMRERQPVGYTDARGRLLVPNLLPYHANLITIDARRLEIDQSIDEPERFVSVRRHGIAHVDFEVRIARALQARLTGPEGDSVALSLGRAWVDGREAESVRIGVGGEIYMEGVAPGDHHLHAVGADGKPYRCALSVTAAAGLSQLGEVSCVSDPPP